jgi:hypothetical protein
VEKTWSCIIGQTAIHESRFPAKTPKFPGLPIYRLYNRKEVKSESPKREGIANMAGNRPTLESRKLKACATEAASPLR